MSFHAHNNAGFRDGYFRSSFASIHCTCLFIWFGLILFTSPAAAQSSLIQATAYLDSVAIHEQKEHFEPATIQYLNALTDGLSTQKDLDLMDEEIRFFKLLLTEDEQGRLSYLRGQSPQDAGRYMTRLWKALDPTPAMNANERLLEHRVRIDQARNQYKDPDSALGIDDRGLTFIRFGEPDRILSHSVDYAGGGLYEFANDLTENAWGARFIVDAMLREIEMQPFIPYLNIWLYEKLNVQTGHSMVFYFSEQENSVFKQIRSIDEQIPVGLYRKPYKMPFAPALAMQYVSYQQLMFEDPVFMNMYDELRSEIFIRNFANREPSVWSYMASRLKSQNNMIESRRQRQAPPEQSSESDLVPDIEIDVHQYRSYNAHQEPVLITFFESRPTSAFLQDLTEHNDLLMGDHEESEQILSIISEWYSLQQGIELFDSEMNQVGRIRDRPVLQLESDSPMPTVTIADIPFIEVGASQVFYSKLFNKHPETKPAQPSLFPDAMRGKGRAIIYQNEHLQFEENIDQLLMSDLIFGYNRIDREDVRFPFIVKNDRIMPEQVNPVIHFELFGLERDQTGFAQFEIEYQFEPKRGFLSLFRQTDDLLSGTLEFSTADTHFRESLEFDNLPLRNREYTLHWVVRDLISGDEITRKLEFSVKESDPFTITTNGI